MVREDRREPARQAPLGVAQGQDERFGRRLRGCRSRSSTGHVWKSNRAHDGYSVVNVALVIPLHGSAGIFGPSCEYCARLAVAEINAANGVLGRELEL